MCFFFFFVKEKVKIKSQIQLIPLVTIIVVQIEMTMDINFYMRIIKISNQTHTCNKIKVKEILFWQTKVKTIPLLIITNDFNIA